MTPLPSNTIVLAGSGRSGTTWLSDILTAQPFTQLVFEPFDARRVPEAAGLPIRPYARPGQAQPHWTPFIHQALTGQLNNNWVNRAGRPWWTRQILLKTIRATLLLGWLHRQFQPRIVYLMRHPCAVVHSRLKLNWDTHLDTFLAQPDLIADHLQPHLPLLQSAQTPAQKHALMWAIENLVPLQQGQTTNWVSCFYETLVSQPQQEAQRVLTALNLPYSWFARRATRRISFVARPGSALTQGQNPLTEWQTQLTQQQISDILTITTTFGHTHYNHTPHPTQATPLAP